MFSCGLSLFLSIKANETPLPVENVSTTKAKVAFYAGVDPMIKTGRLLNLDRMGFDRLEAIIGGLQAHPRRYARKLFPNRPHHYARTANLLALYAIELLTARRYRAQGHIQDAKKVMQRCRAIYEKLPDYARW